MTLPEVLLAIRRSLILIVLAVVVGVAASGAYIVTQPKQYDATAQVFVATSSAADATTNLTFAQQIVGSYAQLATTKEILAPVIKNLGLSTTVDDLKEDVKTTSEDTSLLISITATASTAQGAADIANEVGRQLSTGVRSITPNATTATFPVTLTLVDPATAPVVAARPAVTASLLAGFVGGLILGLVIAIVRARLDTRVRAAKDLEAAFDRPVLGTLLADGAQSSDHVITRTAPAGKAAEAYRALRTNLEFLGADDAVDSLVVTSAVPGEGKSTCVVNLGVVMATADKRVLIIDADLRKPRIAKYTGVDGGIGLTDVLIGRTSLQDAVQQWGPKGLFVLPAGTAAPNPSELLHSRAMAELAKNVREEYDVVLFDSPPLTAVTDAAIVARLTSGALVACALGRTRGPQTEVAVDALTKAQAGVLGFVATFSKGAGKASYSYADPAKKSLSASNAPGSPVVLSNRT